VKYAMWAAGYPPDMVVVNPADWGAMERERERVASASARARVRNCTAR
jgi:hypothetical protein